MNQESSRIADQAGRMFDGEAWHGPSVSESLAGVDAELAFGHPIEGTHSIWELVLHLSATQAIVLRRLRGEAAGVNDEEFWPEAPRAASAPEWAEALDRLRRQEGELRQAIAGFPDARLDAPPLPGGNSAYANLHGHIQHNAYHAGQIMLLKRLGRAGRGT